MPGIVDRALYGCGHLCAATGRPAEAWAAEAVTVWAAEAVFARQQRITAVPSDARRRQEVLSGVRRVLGPARTRAAEERGAAMSLAAAAEYALLLTAPVVPGPGSPPGPGTLSARERELVILVARGRTDAQIAAELYISVRTVHTHLDRIRDKTGCRPRADLTGLALQAGLV